jgi:hypothetical protein
VDSAFTIEDCIHDAIERIGGQAGTASEIRSARRSVRLLLEEWAAMRLNTWRRQSIDLTLPSSEGSHVLPDDVDDVLDVLISDEAGRPTRTSLDRASFDQWMDWPNKSQGGWPTGYFVERTEPPRLYFLGLGNAGQIATVWYAVRPNGWSDDLPGRWLLALTHGLAYDLAQKRPPFDEVTIARLEKNYMQRLDLCSRNDRDRVSFRAGIR